MSYSTAEDNHTVKFSKQFFTCSRITVKKYIPILSWLPHYSLEDLKGDMIAGFTVGLTVVPQGLALSQLASLPPQYGLYTAFMGSFMYAIFGTCKDLVIGPTSVMALMTAEYAQLGGPVYAVLLTFLCGCLQLLLGILNLGFLVNFVSSPVLSGFMSSAALIIATTQIKGLLGLKFRSSGFLDMVYKTGLHIPETNFYDLSMGLSSVFFLLLLRHFKDKKLKKDKFPDCVRQSFETVWWSVATARNAIIVVLCSGLASTFLSYDIDVLTLTEHVEAGLPRFSVPQFSLQIHDASSNSTIYKDPFEILKDLGSGAVVVPFLSLLEAVAIAMAFSRSRKLDATREIVALGMGNLMGSFVSSYPVTGSFSRTVINNSSGVRTPLGGIFSGSLVLLALGIIAPSFHYIPKACLSAIIFSAVIFMIHYKDIPSMWHTSRLELIPFLTTCVCSLTLGLEKEESVLQPQCLIPLDIPHLYLYGLLLGIAVSLGMLLYKQNKPHVDIEVIRADNGCLKIYIIPDRSIYFPSIDYIKGKVTKVLCVDLKNITISQDSNLDLLHTEHVFYFYTTDDGILRQYPNISSLTVTPALYTRFSASPENKVFNKCVIVLDCDNFTGIDYSAIVGLQGMVQNLMKDKIVIAFKITKPSVKKTLSSLQALSVVYQTEEELQALVEGNGFCSSAVEERNSENDCCSVEPLVMEPSNGSCLSSTNNEISCDLRTVECGDNMLDCDSHDPVQCRTRL